jgi:hypothetical protein
MTNKQHNIIGLILESLLVFTLTTFVVFTLSIIGFCIKLFFFNN